MNIVSLPKDQQFKLAFNEGIGLVEKNPGKLSMVFEVRVATIPKKTSSSMTVFQQLEIVHKHLRNGGAAVVDGVGLVCMGAFALNLPIVEGVSMEDQAFFCGQGPNFDRVYKSAARTTIPAIDAYKGAGRLIL